MPAKNRRSKTRPLLAALLALACASSQAMYVSGGQVYTEKGVRVQLKGVNWFGLETQDHAPHGLWARNLDDMLDQMQSLGFNALRVPVCPATLHGATPDSINYSLNPDLVGLDSLGLLDTLAARLEQRKMYFLIDHHRPDCDQISELWYTSTYTESQWIADLKFIAKRYKKDKHFLGIDLKNEPHGAASWGSGNASTDWNSAAERAGKAVLASAPHALVFVEGIDQTGYCTNSTAAAWWGGNLGPQRCKPLALSAKQLVLSPHVYGPDVYEQSYFFDPGFPANMPAIWDANFGSLATAGYTVIVGETGGRYGQGDAKDVTLENALFAYLPTKGIANTFYWCWNPNSGDTGGILLDDWISVRTDKMALLKSYWAAGAKAAAAPRP